jgi:hypothetical protein
MKAPHRCLVIVPSTTPERYAQLVTAFADDPRVFVLRDRRGGERPLDSVGVFAVGGGDVDPALRRSVEEKLRSLGALRGPTASDRERSL